METVEFQLATLDRKAKIATFITLLIVIGVAIFFIIQAVRLSDRFGSTILALAACVAMLAGILPLLWAPRKYGIDDEHVSVYRPIGDLKLPLVSINSVQLPDIKLLNKGTVRAMGCGGFFGYYGSFYNDSYGDLKCYLTRTKDSVVLIRCGNLNYLLSPKDADVFVRTLREKITKANVL